MKICILDDSYADSNSPLKAVDLPADPAPYLGEHEWERHFLHKATAVRQVIELSKRGFDVFLNLCDGAWDEDRPGIEVVQTLERLGLAFTGANSTFYDPSRQRMKLVCHYNGIRTPAAVFAAHLADVEVAARSLRFPLIVKHPNSYSSIGMTRASRVENLPDLHAQAAQMIATFGSALIEEFIEGREFTVLVAENPDDARSPIAYVPVEFRFPPGETFKHFEMKWIDYAQMSCAPCTEPTLIRRLQEISSQLFTGLEGTGYGRCDIRMDAGGELYMLEINPNCGVFYPPADPGSADVILQSDPAGHRGFVDAILRSALRRAQQNSKPWRLVLTPGGGYGMIANRELAPGALIEGFEERPHVLVSREHVRRTWPAEQQRTFAQYAYPITEDTYVMWSQNPEEWKPLNHACDPNAWLDGLNLVARRPIVRGEQITVDYATFCNEMMEDFLCSCGSVLCRGIVRGSDHLEPFVARYGEHVSDYVRTKRSARVLMPL